MVNNQCCPKLQNVAFVVKQLFKVADRMPTTSPMVLIIQKLVMDVVKGLYMLGQLWER